MGYAVKDLRIRVAILCIRTATLFLIIRPIEYSTGFPLLLFISFAADAANFLPLPYNGVTGILIVLFIVLKPDSAPIWFMEKEQQPPYQVVEPALLSCIFVLLAVAVDTLVNRLYEVDSALRRTEEINQKLTETNIQFQEYAFDVDRKSSESERNRITGEIHDSVGYSLTNIIMTMEAAGDQLKAGKYESLANLLIRCRTVAKQCLDEIRSTLRILRATKEEIPAGIRAIQKLVKNFENIAEIRVDVEYGNVPWSFGPTVDSCIFHVIQESMTNAIRHGNARRIAVVFWQQENRIQLSVRDDGTGCKEIREGIGLASMRERVSALAGKLSHTNTRDGFVVQVLLPIDQSSATPETPEARSG